MISDTETTDWGEAGGQSSGGDDLPIFGVCGWSGSGKTTLIERAVPVLRERGLRVLIIKHDAHRIEVDRAGKDSDRFFQAGADVLLQGRSEQFLRVHRAGQTDWDAILPSLAGQYDLILVEGHKSTPLRKMWLLADGEVSVPPEASGIVAVLPRDADRLAMLLAVLEAHDVI